MVETQKAKQYDLEERTSQRTQKRGTGRKSIVN